MVDRLKLTETQSPTYTNVMYTNALFSFLLLKSNQITA